MVRPSVLGPLTTDHKSTVRGALGLPGTISSKVALCPCGCGAKCHVVEVEGFIPGELLQVTTGSGQKQTTLITQSGRLRVDDFGLEQDGRRWVVWTISRGKKELALSISPSSIEVTGTSFRAGNILPTDDENAVLEVRISKCIQSLHSVKFTNGLDLIIPSEWSLRMGPSRSCLQGARHSMILNEGGTSEEVKAAEEAQAVEKANAAKTQVRIANEIEESNRLARESRIARRAAAAAGQRRPEATLIGRPAESGVTGPEAAASRDEAHASDVPREDQSGRRMGKSQRGRVPKDFDEEYDRLWRRHPQLFSGRERTPDQEAPPPSALEHRSSRRSRRPRRAERGQVELEELIAIDRLLQSMSSVQALPMPPQSDRVEPELAVL